MTDLVTSLTRLQRISLAVGIGFLLVSGIGIAFDRHAFFVSYLWSYVFWTGLSLGCLNTAMIHYLTGSHWGQATRRFLEAGFMTLPLMAVGFIPLLFGLHELYPWARPDAVAADKLLQQKSAYENLTGFVLRAALIFTTWLLIATRLRQWSVRRSNAGDPTPLVRMRAWSGPGLVLVPLTVTFASVDWIMSIEPAWFSTIFGVILLAGQVLVAFAFVTVLLVWLRPYPPFQAIVTPKHFHDLGNLLLAFVMFWTYVAFSQFLVIYSGNQPHEIGWYLHRIAGTWKGWLAAIAACHFFAPFFILLFRSVKQNPRHLAVVALTLFLAHGAFVFWAVAPTFYPDGLIIHWTDLAVWPGWGGLWLAVFFSNLKRHPFLATDDPRVSYPIIQIADAK